MKTHRFGPWIMAVTAALLAPSLGVRVDAQSEPPLKVHLIGAGGR